VDVRTAVSGAGYVHGFGYPAPLRTDIWHRYPAPLRTDIWLSSTTADRHLSALTRNASRERVFFFQTKISLDFV